MLTNKGLTGFQIKLLALIFMTFDHIHYTFSGVFKVPVVLTILGRIAAPLFIFMVAEGMRYTRSREKYLFRLWIGSVFMGVFNPIFDAKFPLASGGVMIANIFTTLFIICLFIYGAEKVKECWGKKETGKVVGYALVTLLPVITSILLLLLVGKVNGKEELLWLARGFMILFPTLLFAEGGFVYVLLGLGFYRWGKDRGKLTIFYTLMCLLFLLGGKGLSLSALFTAVNIQWLAILALPFMLLYNGERGRSMKYFFYFYYPGHIYVLMILSYFTAMVIS